MALLQSIVSRSLLEAADPRLLVRLLTSHAGFCTRHGIPLLGEGVGDDRWVRRLYRALCLPGPLTPNGLNRALLEIQTMAGERGHDHLINAARQQTLGGFGAVAPLHTIDLAFRTYLDHPEVFQAGFRATATRSAERQLEYVARNDAHMNTGSASLCEELQSKLSEWFQGRQRSGFCEIDIIEDHDEVQLHIIHGQTRRSRGIIKNGERRQWHFRPDQHDLAVYNRQTRRLCLQARYPSEIEQYRRLVGQIFFDDEEHFQCEEIFSVAPIQSFSPLVLSPEGISQLRRVQLREIHGCASGTSRKDIKRDEDLTGFLCEEQGRRFLATHDILKLKLALFTEVRSRAFLVTLNPPNKSSFNRQLAGPIIMDFLIQRGFLSMGRVLHQLALPLFQRDRQERER